MKSINLVENWEFDRKGPHADPLHVHKNGRIIRFTLKPGQRFASTMSRVHHFMWLFFPDEASLRAGMVSSE
jgi:hypothetical protein